MNRVCGCLIFLDGKGLAVTASKYNIEGKMSLWWTTSLKSLLTFHARSLFRG